MVSVSVTRNEKPFLEPFTGIKSVEYFLSIHTLSNELDDLMTFLSLIVGVIHFPILGKTFPFNYYKRMSPKKHYSLFKIFQ